MPKQKKNKGKPNEPNLIDRFTAINTILEVFNENKTIFKAKMESEFKADPARFYRKYVEPLQPKEIEIEDKNKKVIVGFEFTEVKKDQFGQGSSND